MKNKVAEKQPISAKELVTAIRSLGEKNQHLLLCIASKKYAQLSCCSSAREKWTYKIILKTAFFLDKK